jgi:hypothetical protein
MGTGNPNFLTAEIAENAERGKDLEFSVECLSAFSAFSAVSNPDLPTITLKYGIRRSKTPIEAARKSGKVCLKRKAGTHGAEISRGNRRSGRLGPFHRLHLQQRMDSNARSSQP